MVTNATPNDDDLFTNAFTYAAIGMALVSPDGTWLKVNEALCNMLGYSASELATKTFQDITHPDDLEQDMVYVYEMLAGDRDTYQMEKRYFHKDGHIIETLLSVSLVFDKNNMPLFFISQIQDITSRKELKRKLKYLSQTDSLTRVSNRRYFIEHATREMIRGERFREPQALMMIDIDHFKHINDTYGHDIGDEVIIAMATECRSVLREVDIFGRLGGEEFGALLLNTDYHISKRLAERVRERIENIVINTDQGAIQFTASIGVIAYLGKGKSFNERLKAADGALYKAKQSGRNKVVAIQESNSTCTCSTNTQHESFIQLQWLSEFECGNRKIDSQHRNLFKLANDLLTEIITGHDDKKILFTSKELITHTLQHFRDEYQIIHEAGYPYANEHATIHNSLAQEMQSIVTKFSEGDLSVGDLFDFLACKVISEHMLVEDHKFFPYVDATHEQAKPAE